ncbi:MAG TPA: glycosyltransferase family 39 protein [Vicinamibacterales bacterium]|nr:glycosyltransferase family 39 protein [Vicinamibacterales bacterium]
MRSLQRAALILVLAASTALYTYALEQSPVYMTGDEVHFANGGLALAKNGRSLNGELFPLFVNLHDPLGDPVKMPWGDTWFHPILFYLIALSLKVQPFSEAAVRLPPALIGGLLTPLLVYLAARRMRFEFPGALVAAILTSLTPVSFILSREAVDYSLLVPFAIAWVWCLADYLETRRVRSAVLGGVILGVGCYSYIAAWALLPCLLGISWLAYWRSGAGWPRAVLGSAAGFAPAFIVVLVWLSANPTALPETIERYRVLDSHRPLADQQQMGNLATLLPLYARYFEWTFLFRTGGASLLTSTGLIGVFLKPIAVLAPIGLFALWRRKDRMLWPLLAALLIAPLPAAASGHAEAIHRAQLMVPFGLLFAAAGWDALWRSRVVAWRAGALVLVAATVVAFRPFWDDYFTGYRNRSAFYYDMANIEGVVKHIVGVQHLPAVLLTRSLNDGPARWRFHLTTAGRSDLLARTLYVNDGPHAASTPVPVDSRLVMYVEGLVIKELTASGAWEVEAIIKDVDDREAAAVLRKIR